MSSLKKELPWRSERTRHPVTEAGRCLVVGLLMVASAALARLAATLTAAPAVEALQSRDPRLEFHAEAGAPEGALYVDGELIGRLHGVRRL